MIIFIPCLKETNSIRLLKPTYLSLIVASTSRARRAARPNEAKRIAFRSSLHINRFLGNQTAGISLAKMFTMRLDIYRHIPFRAFGD